MWKKGKYVEETYYPKIVLNAYELCRTPIFPSEVDLAPDYSQVKPALICPICTGLLRNTRIGPNCQHRYCKECITAHFRMTHDHSNKKKQKLCPVVDCGKELGTTLRALAPDEFCDLLVAKVEEWDRSEEAMNRYFVGSETDTLAESMEKALKIQSESCIDEISAIGSVNRAAGSETPHISPSQQTSRTQEMPAPQQSKEKKKQVSSLSQSTDLNRVAIEIEKVQNGTAKIPPSQGLPPRRPKEKIRPVFRNTTSRKNELEIELRPLRDSKNENDNIIREILTPPLATLHHISKYLSFRNTGKSVALDDDGNYDYHFYMENVKNSSLMKLDRSLPLGIVRETKWQRTWKMRIFYSRS